MSTRNDTRIPASVHSWIRACALVLTGLSAAFVGACAESEEDLPLFGELDCENYCERAKTCNDGVDVDSCTQDCVDFMSDCQADEQDEALDEIDMCSNASCDDFAGCSIDAGATCIFGL